MSVTGYFSNDSIFPIIVHDFVLGYHMTSGPVFTKWVRVLTYDQFPLVHVVLFSVISKAKLILKNQQSYSEMLGTYRTPVNTKVVHYIEKWRVTRDAARARSHVNRLHL